MTDTSRYQIIESPLGPLISESRVTVYDVLEAHDSGLDEYQIATCYNLTPLQVQTALAYIAEHRARLEPELAEILRVAAEREAYYRALAAEREATFGQEPMTAQRAALNALKARLLAHSSPNAIHADHPQ